MKNAFDFQEPEGTIRGVTMAEKKLLYREQPSAQRVWCPPFGARRILQSRSLQPAFFKILIF
jgi:hypothetical protein